MKSHARQLAFAGLIALALAPSPRAQRVDPPAVHADRLEVKLAAGCGAELRDGRLRSRTGVDLSPVARWFEQATVAPLVTAVPRATLDAWHAHACAVLPEHNRPGHLGLWFRLVARDAADADRLRRRLLAEPLVEHAYCEPILYPASANGDIPPTTPSFVANQQTHGASPLGHGARVANSVLGGRGLGVGIRMIENNWIWGHEDICKLVTGNVLGAPLSYVPGQGNHGTAGASIMFADRNGYGVTGISDQVDAKFLNIDLNGGYANSIALTIANSQPGDVAIIVLMILVPGLGPGSWLPLEFLQSNFDATLTATANGLHVVLPAGNGGRNLDDPALLGRFDRSFRDSGSILVGASDGGTFQRAPFSNFGSRVDAHSWGDNVYICGYGTIFSGNPGSPDPLQSYTNAGTGTSSATPHIAAVVAAIQGAALRQTGQLLSNAEILDLLHTHGPTTPDVIGRRPDLVAILDDIGAIDGLLLDGADVDLGGSVVATMTGLPTDIGALFAGFAAVNLPIGFNRNIHLDPLQMISVGVFTFPTGSAQYQLPIPNDASLHGTDLYFQAVKLPLGAPLFLTNSCQVTVL